MVIGCGPLPICYGGGVWSCAGDDGREMDVVFHNAGFGMGFGCRVETLEIRGAEAERHEEGNATGAFGCGEGVAVLVLVSV